jgi:hypothetical protein
VSAFLSIASTSFGALDTAFGDSLTITPQICGEFVAEGPDPNNPPFVAIGILDIAGVVDEGAGRKDGTKADVSTTVPIAEFAFTQFGSGRPLPKAGWRIDCPPETLRESTNGFQVVDRLPDGDDGRVRFQLVAL